MADDPTIPPKPTPRRRRTARSTVPPAAPVIPSAGDPGATEPAGSEPGADPATPDEATAIAGDGPGVGPDDGAATDAAAVPAAAASADTPATGFRLGAIPAAGFPEPDGDQEAGVVGPAVWPRLDSRSPDEWICPFLRSLDDREQVGLPMELPAVANRCASQPGLVPQSLRQQELVCLTMAHLDCPRYTRGAAVAIASDVAPVRTRSTSTMTPAMLAALTFLAAAFTASVVFTLARGSLDLPAAAVQPSRTPSASAAAVTPTAAPSVTSAVEGSAAPSAGATASSPPTPIPSVAPSPTPAVTSPTPVQTPTAAPTSDRYALLTACPDKPDCWLYRVRAGDNLFSIANYFGVPLARVKALNPWTANGLRAGRDLILPPPTR